MKANHARVTDTIAGISEKPQRTTGQQPPLDAVEEDTKPAVIISQPAPKETEAPNTIKIKDIAEEHETSIPTATEKEGEIKTIATADKGVFKF